MRGHDLTIEAARSAGLRVGILTNGPSAWQRRKLELTGIGDALDAVAISAELGAAKPDPPRSTAPASCWAWRPG